jgi:elongation factor Ts
MTITAEQVKELRQRTGAGMMDCKRALSDTDGNIDAAITALRKAGIAAASKKAGRAANEGQVFSYIHPGGRVGVLIEVSCETDFVARTDDFQSFCRELAMQVAATEALVVDREALDQERLTAEREIFRSQAVETKKPDNVIDRIVDGKMEKFYNEVVLLEQASVRDSDRTVKEMITDAITRMGENIIVRRFTRYRLGEA